MTRSFLFGCLLLVSTALPAFADTVLLNDCFDHENNGSFSQNYSGFSQWNVTRGVVDLIGNGDFDFLPGNGLYLDMDGSNLTGPGRIESKKAFDLVAGEMYTLRFDIGNSDDRFGGTENLNLMTVSIGSYTENFSRNGFQDFEFVTRTFSPTVNLNSQRIVFDHLGERDAIGLLVDDIQFTCESCAVPEPSSELLLSAALLLFTTRARRITSKALTSRSRSSRPLFKKPGGAEPLDPEEGF